MSYFYRPPKLSRRDILRLMASGISFAGLGGGALLSGCGGANNPFGVTTTTTVGNFDLSRVFERPAPTGTLEQQIDQHARAVDALSRVYDVPPGAYEPAITRFTILLSTLGVGIPYTSATDLNATAEVISRARQAAASDVPIRQITQTIDAGIALMTDQLERACSALVQLDSVGYLGDEITRQFGLTGGTSLSNPQWNLAFAERLFDRMTSLSGFIRGLQTLGVADRVAEIAAIKLDTDADLLRKVAQYVNFADGANAYFAKVYTTMGITQPQTAALNEDIAPDQINAELARVQGIIDRLPLGLPYRGAAGKHRALDFNFSLGALNNLISDVANARFLPNAAPAPVTPPPAPPAPSLPAPALPAAPPPLPPAVPIGSEVSRLAGKAGRMLGKLLNPTGAIGQIVAQGAAELIFDQLKTSDSAGTKFGATLAKCAIDVLFGGVSLAGSITGLITTGVTGIGLIGFGALTITNSLSLYNSIKQCGSDLASAADDWSRERLKGMTADGADGEQSFPPRNVPAITIEGAECDQLSRAGVGDGRVTGAPPSGPRPPDFHVPQITVPQARALLEGTGTTGPYPRTPANLRNAAVAVMNDMAKRAPSLTKPSLSNDNLSYQRSNYGSLLRREPGQNSALVPAIPDALLLCTGIGQLPMRNVEPKNLTDLPPLMKSTIVGTGVTANVQ